MINALLAGVLGLFALADIVPTDPNSETVLLGTSAFARQSETDSTLAAYYTVSYALPQDLTSDNLEYAFLELYLDVSAKVRGDDFYNPSPVLELYALTEAFSGHLDTEILDRSTRAIKPVSAGAGRRVVLDVTNIVRAHLAGTIDNNGLVMGSLTGMREGEFAPVEGRLPQSAVGRLRIQRRHQFVPADVPSERKGSDR